jgi:hypothetical protein
MFAGEGLLCHTLNINVVYTRVVYPPTCYTDVDDLTCERW